MDSKRKDSKKINKKKNNLFISFRKVKYENRQDGIN
jgi:hypothetical protein